MTPSPRLDIYTRVTEQIIECLERGVMPWRASWKGGNRAAGGAPMRACGIPYKGVNVLLLWMAADSRGYASNVWMTFKQALELGACVRKGEKGTSIVYAGSTTAKTDDETGEAEARGIPFLKGYTVFNVEQIDGLPETFAPSADEYEGAFADPKEPIADIEAFFATIGPTIVYGGTSAHLSRPDDTIHMPRIDDFTSAEAYYATLAHEVIHWTQQKSRLDRVSAAKQHDGHAYARLELEAEIGAAYLGAQFGFAPFHIEDHAAYIDNWLAALKHDKRAIFTAASHAQKAVDYLNDLAVVGTA